MTNLTRVTGKVFGGEAPLNQIGQFGSAKTGTKLNTQDVATIQALPAYSQGWGSAIMTSRNFPPIEEVTGALKTISYQNCYLLQEGVPTYDIGTNYSDTSIVKVINGTNISFYLSLTNDNIGNPLSDTDHWVKVSFVQRTIGEIVTSTIPLSDSGFHLLDGSELTGTGIYTQFVSYIASIYNSSLNYFCTESEWQEAVTTYGICGKFVYTPASGNNPAKVRLPKITGFIEGGEETTLGDLTEAGLPAHNHILYSRVNIQNNWFGYEGGRYSGYSQPAAGETYTNTTQNANNPIYGKSNTVQPQSIKVLYYIVVATTAKTDIEVDINEIATDLNGKADVDLTNVNNSGTSNGASWSMPSGTYVDLTLGTSGATYTAPANGWVQLTQKFTQSGHNCGISSINTNSDGLCMVSDLQYANVYIPVNKNQSFKVWYSGTRSTHESNRFVFIYSKGSESEYTP